MSGRSLGSSVVEVAVDLRGVNKSFRHDNTEKFARRSAKGVYLSTFARRMSSTMYYGCGGWFRILMCM